MLCKLHNPTNTKCTRNFFIAVIAEIVDSKYIHSLHNLHNVYWSVCVSKFCTVIKAVNFEPSYSS